MSYRVQRVYCLYPLQMIILVLQDDDDVWVRRFHYTRPYSYSLDYIFRPVAFDSITESVVTLEIFTSTNSYHVSTHNIETGGSTLDRVSNRPYNASHFIKAFVLSPFPSYQFKKKRRLRHLCNHVSRH